MRTVAVPGYDVVIGGGLLQSLGEHVRRVAPAHRYAIIADETVRGLYGDAAVVALAPATVDLHVIPPGEAEKTRERWAQLTDALLAAGHGRDSVIIALGGGVIGDLAGFVAATFLRGIPFVQVPTTLLAMVDASVGGKTAVDVPAGKNLVGAFHRPAGVVIDPALLQTLPIEHLRAGLAEAIKHGVIAGGAAIDDAVVYGAALVHGQHHEPELERLIARNVEIKAYFVAADEHEHGPRKALNFGHTLGHAIERVSNFSMLHGEAVAIGMVLESELAVRLGIAERAVADEVRAAVRAVGLPDERPAAMPAERLLAATRSDKKRRAGAVEYSLPIAFGRMAAMDRGWSVPVPDEAVLEVLG